MYLLSSCTEDCSPHQWQFGELSVEDAALQVGPAREESAALQRLITAAGLGAPRRIWRGRQGRDFSWVGVVGSHPTSTNVLAL